MDHICTPRLGVRVKPGPVLDVVLVAGQVHGAVREARAAPLALPNGETHRMTHFWSFGCSRCSLYDGGSTEVGRSVICISKRCVLA